MDVKETNSADGLSPTVGSAPSATSTQQTVENNSTNPVNHNNNTVVVELGLYWDEWSRCISSRYQRDQLYRVGKLDGCSKQWNDLKLAGRAKVVHYRNPQEAEALLASTYYKKRTTISPTAGAIWELKEQPSWD